GGDGYDSTRKHREGLFGWSGFAGRSETIMCNHGEWIVERTRIPCRQPDDGYSSWSVVQEGRGKEESRPCGSAEAVDSGSGEEGVDAEKTFVISGLCFSEPCCGRTRRI